MHHPLAIKTSNFI